MTPGLTSLAAALLTLSAAPFTATPLRAQKAVADISSFSRYQRTVSPASTGQACALLDAAIYPHAAPFLKDLRLYQTSTPGTTSAIPYVLTLSEPQLVDSESARVLNLGLHGRDIVFDLAMPGRNYTDVTLDLNAHNFIGSARVSGSQAPGAANATSLGAFTVYDLAAQHLSRSTTLHLQEMNFPYLHVILNLAPASGAPAPALSPQLVRGAEVPPSREAQTLFTPSARTTEIAHRGSQSVATFNLPERVPVERVSVELAPGFTGNFSREIHISARSTASSAAPDELLTGTLRRVRLTQSGREIHEEQLGIPAILGANLQDPATVEVAIENGDAAPLPVTAVRLEMRQRKLCFNARPGLETTLFYGDPDLPAPQYDFGRIFTPAASAVPVHLGPEEVNPRFHPRPDLRPPSERHASLLWIALLIATGTLGLVAYRSARQTLR